MIQAKCIQKFRDKNNNIYGYRLQDINGQIQDVQSANLKNAIASGQINVVNLTLTKDGRLVDTTEKQLQSKRLGPAPTQLQTQSSKHQQIVDLVKKAKQAGIAKEIQIYQSPDQKCYVVSKSVDRHIIYIPDSIVDLNGGGEYKSPFNEYVKNLQGSIIVSGGDNLMYTTSMFRGCKAQSIDLSELNTSNVIDMMGMFMNCKAKTINFGNIDTSNVTNMNSMFHGCEAQSLNLSMFNTSNVEDMANMFSDCLVERLNISNFDTSNVVDASYMFKGCKARMINLGSFNDSRLANKQFMFHQCLARVNTTNTRLLRG